MTYIECCELFLKYVDVERRLSKCTSSTYNKALRVFGDYLAQQGIDVIESVTSSTIQYFIMKLKKDGKEIASITTTKVTETFQFAGKGLRKGRTYTLYCDDEEICTITLTGKVTTVDDSGTETSVSGMMMGGGHVRS
jgi:hypothetical protein